MLKNKVKDFSQSKEIVSQSSWGYGGAVSPCWGPGVKPLEKISIFDEWKSEISLNFKLKVGRECSAS